MTPNPELQLPGAIARLRHAIRDLIEPATQYTNNQLLSAPSLYVQLFDATPSEHISGRRELAATAVTWIDALRLRWEIDDAVEIAADVPPAGVARCARHTDTEPATIWRLRAIQARTWRPQDVYYIQKMTKAIQEWAAEIRALLDPRPDWRLPDPCPSCDTQVVYVRKDGELVRQDALKISPDGCHCLACHAEWVFPARLAFLAKLLGRALPAGVLE